MEPTMALLTQAQDYTPLATGYAHHRRYPTDGLPFMSSPLGGLAAMGATPQLQRMMGQVGMVPMGVGHDQNTYDRLMNQRFTVMQMQAMQQAAQQDRDNYFRTFRGLAAVTGTPFGYDQRRAAQALANNATMMAPMFADMMPNFLDQLGGSAGSATVMARRFIDAGRYRLDPISGRMGMSADTVGGTANALYRDLYAPNNMPQMRGITAGQVGSMFSELQMRGMIGTSASSGYNPAAELQRNSPNAISPADLDKLMLDPRIGEKLRSFDTSKIKRSIQQYTDVVAAMRDIFGDMGKPNAPMAELVAGIEAMTVGGMSQIDPSRLSMMVRQTYNLAKQTGVSMNNALMLQNHAANRAAQMGIEPSFAMQATQGSLAFGGAYRAQGHAAHTAWGTMNADQLQQLDANLRIQAASSHAANRMAVATRMAESIGGFDTNTDAGRFVMAVRNGQTEFVNAAGKVQSTLVGDSDFVRMMTGARGRNGQAAGFSEGDVQTMLGQRDTNREYVDRFGITNTVRRMQGTDEIQPFIGHVMQTGLTSRFRDRLMAQGMSEAAANERATAVAAQISQRVTKNVFGMSTEAFADTAQRNAGIGGFIEQELRANGAEDILAGLSPEARRSFLTSTADRFYGSANRSLQNSTFSALGNLQNVHRITNTRTLNEADRQQMQARFTAEMQEALSPLGHGSLLQRAVDALHGTRASDPRNGVEVVAQALGGVRIEDINRSLMPKFQALNSKRRAVEQLQEQLQRTTDPAQKTALFAQLDVARKELTAQAEHLAKTGEQFGLFTAESLTHQDLARTFDSTGTATSVSNDLTGLRGGFGNQVSAEQIARFRAGDGKGTDAAITEEIRKMRRMTPFRADAAAIADLQKQFPQMTRGEAEDLANMRNRAVRLGIDEEDVTAYRNKDKTKFAGPYGEMAAIGDLFAMQAAKQFDVSDAEIGQLARDPSVRRPSQEQINRFREENKLSGSDDDVVREMRRRMVYLRKRTDSRNNWGDFWGSIQGGAAREAFDAANSDIENVASKLIASPQMVQRLGMQAVDVSDSLRGDQQRLRELAMYHTGGDLSKLLAGDYSAMKAKTPEEARELAAKLGTEVNTIRERQKLLLAQIASTEGGEGRRFQLGNEEDARRSVLAAEVRAGRMTQADADKLSAAGVSPAMSMKIETARRELGSEARARAILNIDPRAVGLSDVDRARISAIRFGAGNEEEARLLYGPERWDKLTTKQREEVLRTMRVGTASDAESMKLLDVSKEQLAEAGPLSELARRVSATTAGLSSDTHARQIAGPQNDTDDATYAKHLRWTRKGLYDPSVAREHLGLGADELDATLRLKIDREREAVGNRREALRLMGKKPSDALSADEQKQLEKLTYDVGIARRISPSDESVLANFNPLDVTSLATIAQIASNMGVRPDDLVGATAVSKKLQAEQLKASRRANANPLDMTRDILKEFGFQTGELPSAFENEFSRSLTSPEGRGMAQRIISSQQGLSAVAKRRGDGSLAGIDSMASEYFKAVKSGRAEDMEAFRKNYGMYDVDKHGMVTGDSATEFSQFEKAMQFQQQTGLLGFGSGGGRNADQSRLQKIFANAVQIGDRRDMGPQRQELSGTVTLKGDQLDFLGAWGSRNFTPGTP